MLREKIPYVCHRFDCSFLSPLLISHNIFALFLTSLLLLLWRNISDPRLGHLWGWWASCRPIESRAVGRTIKDWQIVRDWLGLLLVNLSDWRVEFLLSHLSAAVLAYLPTKLSSSSAVYAASFTFSTFSPLLPLAHFLVSSSVAPLPSSTWHPSFSVMCQ